MGLRTTHQPLWISVSFGRVFMDDISGSQPWLSFRSTLRSFERTPMPWLTPVPEILSNLLRGGPQQWYFHKSSQGDSSVSWGWKPPDDNFQVWGNWRTAAASEQFSFCVTQHKPVSITGNHDLSLVSEKSNSMRSSFSTSLIEFGVVIIFYFSISNM